MAKQLASDEYEDFPTIEEEIIMGASDVEAAAKQLNEATITLAKGTPEDRPGAWDSLGDAVRIMAQNTAILLHIVYGAEIKKVFALSNYTDGKLRDLLRDVQGSPTGLYEKNPQLFVNKVQAAMEDVQKLAQGVRQKASEEDSDYARKELEDVASKLLAGVEPFVAHANELLADPANVQAKDATVKDLKDMLDAADKVGAPKPKQGNMQSFIPELMECVTKMQDIEPATPEGEKEAARLLNTLDAISRANKVGDMGPHTRMINNIVDLHKDLDQIEALLNNPDVKPLGNVDPLSAVEPDAQGLLNIVRKMQPDDDGGKDRVLQDAEKLAALLTDEVLPLCRNVRSKEDAAALSKAKDAIQQAHKALDDVTAGMGLNPEQTAQVKGATKVNSICIKLGAMAGSKNHSKVDVFSAAKDLTEMLGEMSSLLGLAQELGSGSAGGDGASGALQSQMAVSAGLVTTSQPKPKPKPGSAKAMMKKLAPAATKYQPPVIEAGSRDSVGAGFLSVGVGAEELKTMSMPSTTKGADLLPDTDPVITGVRSLGEQLGKLSKAATEGDNAALLAAGKAIHEQIKAYAVVLKKRAASAKDPRAAHELITLANQLQNWAVQLKILSSVKASSGGGKDSDKSLIAMCQSISSGLRGAPDAVLRGLLVEVGASRASQRSSVRK